MVASPNDKAFIPDESGLRRSLLVVAGDWIVELVWGVELPIQ